MDQVSTCPCAAQQHQCHWQQQQYPQQCECISNSNFLFVAGFVCGTILTLLVSTFLYLGFKVSKSRLKREKSHLFQCNASGVENGANESDGAQQVLAGVISLFCREWNINDHHYSSIHEKCDNLYTDSPITDKSTSHEEQLDVYFGRQRSKVVKYLSPEEIQSSLFKPNPNTIETNNVGCKSKDKGYDPTKTTRSKMENSLSLRRTKEETSHNSDDDDSSSNNGDVQTMIRLFQVIQTYSVKTSHKYFFNQLFGTLDPVALAAEVLALSVNTSAYTFETAPVFTMLEREVILRLGRLVFQGFNEECDDNMSTGGLNRNIDDKIDGLMLPGGSLSNLTALHVARHHWNTKNGLAPSAALKEEENEPVSNTLNVPISHEGQQCDVEYNFEEEKKCGYNDTDFVCSPPICTPPQLVAFVSSEAHYSFKKSVSVTGIGIDNLISVPTLSNGQIDIKKLEHLMTRTIEEGNVPFFIAATAGSTVRGSFDDIEALVKVCSKFEQRMSTMSSKQRPNYEHVKSSFNHKIWLHVDGAWGGSAIFSQRPDICNLIRGLKDVDSFTFNPHKMLGTPQQTTAFVTKHKGILKASNSSNAKYLFDTRKNGAEYDLGDGSYTCGRRTDAIKLWAIWKFYGSRGLGKMVESKVDILAKFATLIREHESFMLACCPWPFNLNFFYLPIRLRKMLKDHGIDTTSSNPILPDEISRELSKVSVKLKLSLHESGDMLIPYQPISNQKADCFRIVLAGNKDFDATDIDTVMLLMDKHGCDL